MNVFQFRGKVRKHNQRGSKLGFPTANVNLTRNIPAGIYISKIKLQGLWYQSLTFIGRAETFDEKFFHAETYILDFNKDIYGKWVSVKLIKKIRTNKKFNSPESLIKQMKKDEEIARRYFQISG